MVEYEWDPAKAAANRRKHGIAFADAIGVFEDERAITIEETATTEERFKTLGCDFLGRVLVVVPVLYAYLDGWKERRRTRHARRHAPKAAAGDVAPAPGD